MELAQWKDLSEVIRNFVQALVLIGGVAALIQWLHARRDRATEVLLQLEDRFNHPDVQRGRKIVESDGLFGRVREALVAALERDDPYGAGYHATPGPARAASKAVRSLDPMLRFYVLLCGVRAARQVPDASLAKCFRYWLAHYYSPARRELRLYIDAFYPTLSHWLRDDRRRHDAWFRSAFFDPEAFGWHFGAGPSDEDVRKAARGRVLVITGAGVSQESGIPTYRGSDGYWRKENPRALARRSAFDADPAKIWTWYCERRQQTRLARPNAAHHAIARLATTANDFLLVTQNVDRLHEQAGLDEARIVHIHGLLDVNACTACRRRTASDVQPEPPPLCECGAPLRPAVVWFDEDLEQSEVERVERFLARGPCDLVLVIGTTASFSYIIDWSLRPARRKGCLVEINPNRSAITGAVDRWIDRAAAQALPALLGEPYGQPLGAPPHHAASA